MEWRQLQLKHEWQLLVCAATDQQQQVAHRQYKFKMDGHVRMVVLRAVHKWQEFSSSFH